MHNHPAIRRTERPSRMLAWGRVLMVTGAALVILAWGTEVAGSSRADPAFLRLLLRCGAGGAAVGVFLAALGAIEQRVIETRALILTAIERQKAEAPIEANFRSRPTGRPWLRASDRKR